MYEPFLLNIQKRCWLVCDVWCIGTSFKCSEERCLSQNQCKEAFINILTIYQMTNWKLLMNHRIIPGSASLLRFKEFQILEVQRRKLCLYSYLQVDVNIPLTAECLCCSLTGSSSQPQVWRYVIVKFIVRPKPELQSSESEKDRNRVNHVNRPSVVKRLLKMLAAGRTLAARLLTSWWTVSSAFTNTNAFLFPHWGKL